jgi:hypothetical protein
MSAQEPQRAPTRYVEVEVVIHHANPSKDFAFGSAVIDGRRTDIYVGAKACAKKDGDRWTKEGVMPDTPMAHDTLLARVCLGVEAGKKPFAAFWQYATESPADEDDFDSNDYWDDDLADKLYDFGEPCEGCGCAPCRCEPEF